MTLGSQSQTVIPEILKIYIGAGHFNLDPHACRALGYNFFILPGKVDIGGSPSEPYSKTHVPEFSNLRWGPLEFEMND